MKENRKKSIATDNFLDQRKVNRSQLSVIESNTFLNFNRILILLLIHIFSRNNFRQSIDHFNNTQNEWKIFCMYALNCDKIRQHIQLLVHSV